MPMALSGKDSGTESEDSGSEQSTTEIRSSEEESGAEGYSDKGLGTETEESTT